MKALSQQWHLQEWQPPSPTLPTPASACRSPLGVQIQLELEGSTQSESHQDQVEPKGQPVASRQ